MMRKRTDPTGAGGESSEPAQRQTESAPQPAQQGGRGGYQAPPAQQGGGGRGLVPQQSQQRARGGYPQGRGGKPQRGMAQNPQGRGGQPQQKNAPRLRKRRNRSQQTYKEDLPLLSERYKKDTLFIDEELEDPARYVRKGEEPVKEHWNAPNDPDHPLRKRKGQRRCYKCGEKGHKEEECISKRIRVDKRVCNHCKEQGHIARDCQNRGERA